MRPADFAFTIKEGLPVETSYVAGIEKEDKLLRAIKEVMPKDKAISHKELVAILGPVLKVQKRAAIDNIKRAEANGYIVKNQAGNYYLKKEEVINDTLPF